MNPEDIISVSEYLDRVNLNLKSLRAKILGEISGVQEYPGRSYLYFSIKDKKDQSTVKCFMWKRDYLISGVEIKDGMEVVVSAYPSIYKPNGGMTLQVESVELVGEGALKLAYEELKKKLTLEGLLSDDRKREIPEYPHRIGVITSRSGAVINDFLTNIGKFGYEILFVDSKVEGQDAIKDLLSAVKTLSKKELDVLVIMRGGGSLESFQAFNNEMLVRAVASFPVPVLTGIGHDKDVSLVGLVSDRNVSTPTAVANFLNKSWTEALSKVAMGEEKILSNFQSLLRDKQYFIENSKVELWRGFTSLLEVFHKAEETMIRSLDTIGRRIKEISEKIVVLQKDLIRGFEYLAREALSTIKDSEKSIELSSPERQLSKGYSIIRNKKGKVVKSIKSIVKGDELDIMVSDGIIQTITK